MKKRDIIFSYEDLRKAKGCMVLFNNNKGYRDEDENNFVIAFLKSADQDATIHNNHSVFVNLMNGSGQEGYHWLRILNIYPKTRLIRLLFE